MMLSALVFRVSVLSHGSASRLSALAPSSLMRLPAASFASAASSAKSPEAKDTRKKLRLLKKEAVKAPKRPLSAHTLFFKDNFSSEAANPAYAKLTGIAKNSAVMTAVMARFKALPPAQKSVYEKRSAEAKAAYQKEYSKFLASRTPEQLIVQEKVRNLKKKLNPTKSVAKVGKDPKAPKRPESAFLLFFKKNRGSADVSTLAKQWKSLAASEKATFNAEYQKAKEIYNAAKEKYQKSTGIIGIRKALNKELEKAVKKPTTGRKKKSAVSKAKSSKKKTAAKRKPAKRTSRVAGKKTVKRSAVKGKKPAKKPVKKIAKSTKKVLFSKK
ncbi:hypothetical protein HDU82_004583 [Entophlyctis luteolus]|nr:hypothetical protein HDU82_004583 [Entophlyctis luteolus]